MADLESRVRTTEQHISHIYEMLDAMATNQNRLDEALVTLTDAQIALHQHGRETDERIENMRQHGRDLDQRIESTRQHGRELDQRIESTRQHGRELDQRIESTRQHGRELDQRIERLVSGIGELVREMRERRN